MSLRRLFAFVEVKTRNRDFSPTDPTNVRLGGTMTTIKLRQDWAVLKVAEPCLWCADVVAHSLQIIMGVSLDPVN
jgi:hypothetical protein